MQLLRGCVYCDTDKDQCVDRFELAHRLMEEIDGLQQE